jgi:hypothetical protein
VSELQQAPDRDDPLLVMLSIDTEEDNWVPTRSGVAVENIRALPRLNAFLRDLGAKPTYFTAYSVAAQPWAADIIRSLDADGGVEIGAHLHPWNTPPLDEALVPRHTMLKNLPADLQREKLLHLTEVLTDVLDRAPTAFRAGRWGLGPATVQALYDCGYATDSSVMPWVDWGPVDDGSNFVGAPLGAYRLGMGNDVRLPDWGGPLVEIPVSSGYNRRPFELWHSCHAALGRSPFRFTRLLGLADRLGILRKIALSPETDSPRDLIALSRVLIASGVRYVHMFWHSPSLVPGFSPYAERASDVERLYESIATFVEQIGRVRPLRFVTVSEAADLLCPKAEIGPDGGVRKLVF